MKDREMDFTDKAVFGQQMGETAAWAVGEQMKRDDKSWKSGEGVYVGGGSEGKVFPELGK